MLEAHDLDIDKWADTVQYVVNAIREITHEHWILIPGTAWQALDNWVEQSQAPMSRVKDPANKLLIDVHQVCLPVD